MTSGGACKIQLSLRRSLDDGPVFKKQDGGRFDNSVTVKLNLNTKYSLFVTTRPARVVKQILLKAEKLEIDRQKPQRNEDNCCIYHADWSTVGCDVTKSGARTHLPVVIELENGALVEMKLQVKIYPEKESTHSRWGQEFHLLDLDCVCKPGSHVVSIQKEDYI